MRRRPGVLVGALGVDVRLQLAQLSNQGSMLISTSRKPMTGLTYAARLRGRGASPARASNSLTRFEQP